MILSHTEWIKTVSSQKKQELAKSKRKMLGLSSPPTGYDLTDPLTRHKDTLRISLSGTFLLLLNFLFYFLRKDIICYCNIQSKVLLCHTFLYSFCIRGNVITNFYLCSINYHFLTKVSHFFYLNVGSWYFEPQCFGSNYIIFHFYRKMLS